MRFEGTKLSEISQSLKDKCRVTTLTCKVVKFTESIMVGEGENWKLFNGNNFSFAR